MIDKRKESLFFLSQKRAEWFKISLVGVVTPTKEVHPSQIEAEPHIRSSWRCCGSPHRNVSMRWKHCLELKQKLNSKSQWWGQAAGVDFVASSWRGSSRIFFSFFFLRMILVSQWLVGSLCTVHSAFSGSVWYVPFILMWWIQGVTPATLTTVKGVVGTTVYGPFQCGAKE